MSHDVEILYPRGLRQQALPRALQDMRARLHSARTLPYAERLVALNALSDALLSRPAGVPEGMSSLGLPFLAGFLRQVNLEKLVARELPRPEALEHFVPTEERKSLRVLPKGVVCHWVAGNVPLLGMFSWAVSALLGNMNVIRLSTKHDDFVSPLLELLASLSAAGHQLAEETVLVHFDRDNRAAHTQMSEAADVRIAWGGVEAIEAIRTLSSHWECEDIILGPRVSLAVIDPLVATEAMVTRLATDVVYFDQLACTSPQWLFVKGRPGETAFDTFCTQFAAAFGRQALAIPRHPLDFAETYQIQLDRTRLLLEGGALQHDARTQWTLAVVKHPHDRVACTNRFVQIIPFDSLDTVSAYIPRNVQTVITVLSAAESQLFTEDAAHYGVCRFPQPGEGNYFETPWDGIPLVPRLTRWVVRSNPRF
jgi:hypothetical protein